jgi:hypothetical protein
MYCKLQHGIKSEEYLQEKEVRQVIECVWFDWCDFIGMYIIAR